MTEQIKRIYGSHETVEEIEFTKKMLEDAKKTSIRPGTPEFEMYISVGYPEIGTREHALELLAERKKNPAAVPWEIMKKAEAFLAALDTRPTVADVYHPPTDKFGRVIIDK